MTESLSFYLTLIGGVVIGLVLAIWIVFFLAIWTVFFLSIDWGKVKAWMIHYIFDLRNFIHTKWLKIERVYYRCLRRVI